MGTTEIALISEQVDAVTVFTGEKLDGFLARIKAETDTLTPDTTTAKGRKEIAAMAYKVAQSKTHIDNLGKTLVADWKAQAKQVDESRKKSRDFLGNLKNEVRLPLTIWEQAEEERIKAEKEAEAYALAWEEAHTLHDFYLREKAIADKEEAQARKEEEARIKAEEAENARKAKEAAEIAEAARLAREAQIREESERKAKQEAKEAVERAEREKIAAEERAKLAAEQAEKDKKLAVEEAERRAKEEAERVEKERQAKRDAEKAEMERVERERLAKEEAERKAAEKKAANKRHQAKINAEAMRFIKGIHGVTEEQATAIIEEIALGGVPHIKITY